MKIKNFTFLLCVYFSMNTVALPSPRGVVISYSGSDVLTKSLESALRARISQSEDFKLDSGQRNELQLVIAEDVKLKKIANHNQVSYKVNFVSQQKTLSLSIGSCWQEQMQECAEQILRDAKITIRQKP
jgi:hypothetical protein